jgi:hypothetical protein
MSKPKEVKEKDPFEAFTLFDLSNKTKESTEKVEEVVEEPNNLKGFGELEEEIPTEEVKEQEPKKEVTETQEVTNESNDDFSYKPLIERWAEKGLAEFDEEEFKDEDFSQDEVLDKIQERTLNKRFEKKLETYPEKLKKAIEWVENGGDIEQFYDYYYNNARYADIEMSAEDTELQKAILTDYLRNQGETDEDRIKTKVEKYELSGILQDEASDALDKLKKLEAKQEEEQTKSQKAKAEEERLKQIEEMNTLKKTVMEAEDIAGFKITPKIKEQLWNHITKPVDKSGKTKLQINNETKGMKAKLLYAYLDMLDFDVTKLEKQVKSKVTSDLRSKLGKYTDSKTSMNGIGKTEVNEDNPFEGFKRSW